MNPPRKSAADRNSGKSASTADRSRRPVQGQGKKPDNYPTGSIEVVIDSLGQQGDGIATWQSAPLFVPFSLPGERVRAELAGQQSPGHRAILQDVLEPAANRIAAPCRHFGTCGGCALQHLELSDYRRWKTQAVVATLAQRGIELATSPTEVFIPPKTRRRAVFAVTGGYRCQVGFHRAASHQLIHLQQCEVLTPALFALVGALRETLRSALSQREAWDVLATECINGIDVLITAKKAPTNEQRFALADLAQVQLPSAGDATIGIARITWLIDKRGAVWEPIAQHYQPQVSFADVLVDLPPQSFLQPSAAGEIALRDAVMAGVGDAAVVADLYAGCGTFTFPLGRQARVIAVEGAKASVAALNQGARRALVSDRITATNQDLADAPLMPEQLKKVQAVVFDPPRAGAMAQSQQLAKSAVSRVVGVSCNPATFARDARYLIDGGFRLVDLTIVDQFIWSPHVELVARFDR
jgi:23S rRNA (uracil1939-C5)-methyltransferase